MTPLWNDVLLFVPIVRSLITLAVVVLVAVFLYVILSRL